MNGGTYIVANAVADGAVADGTVAVRTSGLSKKFGQQQVVKDLDLRVPTGSIYGFLGPNGAGKTTSIRMLLGLVQPTSGSIEVLGREIPTHIGTTLPVVGSLVDGPAFHPYLSGRANLARLDAVDRFSDPATCTRRVDAALDRVGLLGVAGKHYRAYSLGMRQRLAIAAPLLMPRRLLILDEPTNGLDPQGTREVRHLVESLSEGGATVLVSSHLLSEVEQICTHVGVMNVGTLVAQGTLAEVRAGTSQQINVVTSQPVVAAKVLTELGVTDVHAGTTSAMGTLGAVVVETIAPALVQAAVPIAGLTVDRPSLEDLFVSLTGEGFNVSG